MAIDWEHLPDVKLKERFTQFDVGVFRTKVPGGWLIMLVSTLGNSSTSITYYPDPNHVWDGDSL